MLIEIRDVKLGYCNNCGKPSAVCEMLLRDWLYSFSLCESCIYNIYNKIMSESNKIRFNSVKNERRDS